jgi:hypothetical protein
MELFLNLDLTKNQGIWSQPCEHNFWHKKKDLGVWAQSINNDALILLRKGTWMRK